MKQQTRTVLLEEAYLLVQAKQFLLAEGYSSEEIDILIAEGKVWDKVKQVGRGAAGLGLGAAALFGGMKDAKASDNPVNDARDSVENFKDYVKDVKKVNEIGSDLSKTIKGIQYPKDPDEARIFKNRLYLMMRDYKIRLRTALGNGNMSEEEFEKKVEELKNDSMTANYPFGVLLVKNGGPK